MPMKPDGHHLIVWSDPPSRGIDRYRHRQKLRALLNRRERGEAMFQNATKKDGFSMKLWRGERMCLVGFDVDQPEDDLVGFAIECRSPGNSDFAPLRNRLAFSYPATTKKAVTGARQYPSLE